MNSRLIKIKKTFEKGFTLVEMMVAIAVFSIVMVVAASALLSVIDANRKAQSIKTAINSINFALESISKDMRVGTGYKCLDNSGNSIVSCEPSGHNGVQYLSGNAENVSTTTISYLYVAPSSSSVGKIQKKIVEDDGVGSFEDITSPDINITNMKFYVTGEQPRVVITLSGLAGSKLNTQTTFDLQTSVSQRSRTDN